MWLAATNWNVHFGQTPSCSKTVPISSKQKVEQIHAMNIIQYIHWIPKPTTSINTRLWAEVFNLFDLRMYCWWPNWVSEADAISWLANHSYQTPICAVSSVLFKRYFFVTFSNRVRDILYKYNNVMWIAFNYWLRCDKATQLSCRTGIFSIISGCWIVSNNYKVTVGMLITACRWYQFVLCYFFLDVNGLYFNTDWLTFNKCR